jgi:phage major head subunit gpT-like protein
MSIHSKRHRKARMIQAKADSLKAEMIRAEAGGVEWIEAADAPEGQAKPKKFTIKAYSGGILRVSRYDVGVVIDLQGMAIQTPVPCLLDHESTEIVGHADEANKTASSLAVSGVVSGVGEAADKVVAMAANGFPWRASVGALPSELEWVGEGVSVSVNGKSFKGPLYVARKSELKEVSFVAVAADSRTSVKVAAAAAQYKEHDMKFEQWIEAMGLVLAELRDDQRAKLQAKYDGEVNAAKENAAKAAKEIEASGKTETPPPPKIEAPKFDLDGVLLACASHDTAIEAKAAEYVGKVDSAKMAEIQAGGKKSAIELKAKALKEQWAPVRLEAEQIRAAALFEAELMRAERPAGPAIHASNRDVPPLAIEAAFAQSCGLKQPEKLYKAEVLEASNRFRNIGIQELLLIHARASGYTGREVVNNGNLREVIQAAFSTHTITTLLSSTGNKLLLEGFNQIPQSWRQIAGVKSVSDFKTVTAYRLTAALEYEEVGPGGEIKHGTLGQESYTMAAKTYAKMAALTRTDIINDDLGAFDDLRNRLGLGAAVKMNKVFWTLWINNSAVFTSDRANLVASSALGDSGLATAVAAFRNMAGPDGNLMALEPALLLVPSTLEGTARKFYVSQEMRDTTASTKAPTANIYYNRFRPVVVPELETSTYTGYSTSTWYLLADPAILATAVMCFLDGQQNPTIESTDADFQTLGIQFRGYHDFGAAFSEYRAGVKATA